MTDRAQAFTLEAITAAVLLLATFAVVLSITGTTSVGTSTASQAIQRQQAGIASGAVDDALAAGAVRPSVLFWNESNASFYGVGEKGYYTAAGGPTPLGALLNRTLGDRDVAFNVYVVYVNGTAANGTAQPRTKVLLRQGEPSDDAVRVVRTVTLYDDDVLYAPAGPNATASVRATNTTLSNSSTFYAPDASPGGPVYNVVRIEVVVWRV